ncbi:MAG: hypothetical protein OXM58_06765 [Rhodospirillaceae bacterium]|nr:hypothetical protein [Rhodospirillaceae bacterium]MDE0618670.1 hypothetical protein [Rhodospirillaceae bacterium]
MRRFSLSRPGAGGLLPLALAAGLALTASACMAPSAKQSSAAGPAGQQAAKASGEKAGGKSESWWQRITRSGQEPKEKPWVYGDVRPGKGLLGTDEDGYVLLRKGEGQSPVRSGKPEKVRR